jgi:hypothetical protein
MDAKRWVLVASHIAALLVGVAFGYWNWAPHAVVEAAAPAIVQAPTKDAPNGAVVAERKADPAAKPKQVVPRGSHVERVISADITPDAQQRTADGLAAPCPKTHIDATVVRDADGAGRVMISSPDGVTSNATDTVVDSISIRPIHVWAAGPAFSTNKNYGAWVNRDFGRVRTGLLVTQSRQPTTGQRDFEGWALVGFNFGD